MNKIAYSAPAKVILSGEHAVVYGKPAIISSINLRLTFSVWEGKPHEEPEWFQVIKKATKDYLQKKKESIDDRDCDFTQNSKIPRGMHTGSSAALSVASAAALLEFYTGKEPTLEAINTVAYELEKFFHGKPSGADNSTCCYGGLIYFRKEFEFLKQISSLNFKLPKNIEGHLYLIDSSLPVETTLEMVQRVGKLYNQDPEKIEQVFNKMEKITKRIVLSIATEDAKLFRDSILTNELLLEQIQVASEKSRKLIESLKDFGVGKVTGGGGYSEGSGYILFFADNPQKLEQYLKEKKIDYLNFILDHQGVKKEISS